MKIYGGRTHKNFHMRITQKYMMEDHIKIIKAEEHWNIWRKIKLNLL